MLVKNALRNYSCFSDGYSEVMLCLSGCWTCSNLISHSCSAVSDLFGSRNVRAVCRAYADFLSDPQKFLLFRKV